MSNLKYNIDYSALPSHMQGAFMRYIEHGLIPGSFGKACLENKLVDALGKADEVNTARINDIASWLYNDCPESAWGDEETVRKWSEERQRQND